MKEHVEFLIRLVPGGAVTTYVHKFLKEGQKINVIAPVGDFNVKDTDASSVARRCAFNESDLFADCDRGNAGEYRMDG
jgi:Na+-transporting NADH:ubiquinone oxidoreductase subunit NqrF